MAEAALEPTMAVRQASPALGARVEGVDLARERDVDIAELRGLLLRHHVLVLPNQQLTALELERFSVAAGASC